MLESMPTRQLMSILGKNRAYKQNAERRLNEVKLEVARYKDYLNLIKSVLSTREHIPNKKEAKALRREKATKGR